jgi:glycosyltransferase involved in cell wall biosynthesis
MGSYVPRKCGIATFTKDLRDALVSEERSSTLVLAMDDRAEGYDYPEEVRFQIRAGQVKDYLTAADLLNINQIDVLLVQHEFGIYSGRSGEDVLSLMRQLRMPVITALHTVLAEPTKEQATVMRGLVKLSDRIVVMCDKGVEMLTEQKVPREKIAMIPHGIPDVPFIDPAFYKDRFALEGKTILFSFGLISPGKGIEYAIEALPEIVERHPEVMYLVLGATHPHVRKEQGDAYLVSLQRLAEKCGVDEHVLFHSRYVSLPELCRYLGGADVYLTPYLDKEQIVSGTLAYALGSGKAVVSTPYWHAEEMLADDRGVLVPFRDSQAIAQAVNGLLDDPMRRNSMRMRAYAHTRNMIWKEVGKAYVKVANEILTNRSSRPHPVHYLRALRPPTRILPEINLDHLQAMTDDTGILQHAIYEVPDRCHGYCTDDNSRALVAAMTYYDFTRDESIFPLANTYMAFIHHAFDRENGRFHNFLSYDRKWSDKATAGDVNGRAIWALGLAVARSRNEGMLSFASRAFCQAVQHIESLPSPRVWAFALIGTHAYLERFPGDSMARRLRMILAERLHDAFQRNATPEWPWCEDVVTYDNAKLPQALILSGQWLPNPAMVEQGLRTLEWLVRQQVSEDGTVSIIGNQGWLTRDGTRARFDQQPIDAMALVEACAEAFRFTGDPTWEKRARQCFGWFLGNNETNSVLYDFATGGCRDGLHPHGPNLNEGAESTLAWLNALLSMHRLERSITLAEEALLAAARLESNGAELPKAEAEEKK